MCTRHRKSSNGSWPLLAPRYPRSLQNTYCSTETLTWQKGLPYVGHKPPGRVVAASSYCMLCCAPHCLTNSLTSPVMPESVSQTLSACRRTSPQTLPTRSRQKQSKRQRHPTLQLHTSASSLRIRACHQQTAKTIGYHAFRGKPDQVRGYFLRRATSNKRAKELLATPVPTALTPKRLRPTMRTHAGLCALCQLLRMRLSAIVAYSTQCKQSKQASVEIAEK